MFGIEGIEIYFPKTYVDQAEFQAFNGASKGKYTNGLGQLQLSFTYPCEDINSICLTVVDKLMRNYGIDPSKVGRLEVGTETLIDKSKSTKTVLMDLFKGNSDIEGATSINACYGGTNALLNTLNWITSSSWDGRYGIVVAADIAVYEKGPARCTGGAGAVALLIGPNAPITFGKERSSCMENKYDFFKPNPSSEYPIVDGKISIDCYLTALQQCYEGLKKKSNGKNILTQIDYFCFHSPFYKMVQKAFSKLVKIQNHLLDDKNVAQKFLEKVHPCMLLPQRLGNIYTGSLYSCLISLLLNFPDIANKQVMMFSYGSGLCSTLFTLNIKRNVLSRDQIDSILQKLDNRIKVSCQEYDQIMMEKEINFGKYFGKIKVDYKFLDDHTYYLTEIQTSWKRKYSIQKSQIQFESNRISSETAIMRLENTNKIIKNQDKFYKLTVEERLDYLNQKCMINLKEQMMISGGLPMSNADSMIENAIGKISLPLGVVPHFRVNKKTYVVPMCIEEPSVVAACSSAGKILNFEASSSGNIMIGQIHLPNIGNKQIEKINQNKQFLIASLNQICPLMLKRGGGVMSIEMRKLENHLNYSLDLTINVCEAMGANIVNTICEKAKEELQKLEISTGIAILSNYCTERIAKGWFEIPVQKLGRKGVEGLEVAKRIIQAYNFAVADKYRATTHNKGIMNGIDAVCLATGQDWRAVEAAAHSYASKNNKYTPLSHYEIRQKAGKLFLFGCLEIPIAVGTVGGVLSKNSIYKATLSLMGCPTTRQLSQILVCVGLAQNFAALRALAVEGIQSGHMKLHMKSLVKSEGVPEHLVDQVCEFMSKMNKFDKETIQLFLNKLNPQAKL